MPTEIPSDAMRSAHEQLVEQADETETGEHDNDDSEVCGANESCDASTSDTPDHTRVTGIRRIRFKRLLTYGVLPGLALVLALLAGYLKWVATTAHDCRVASIDSVRAASNSTIAILSYKPDTVGKELAQASERLTGHFKDAYTALIHDVVIPGAQQQRISSIATVPAAAPVSATGDHAVVLVFVNQITTIGNDPPASTVSSVRVTLDKVHDQWRISQFDPI